MATENIIKTETEKSDSVREAEQELVNQLASTFHESWRAGRKLKDQEGFEPRVKSTKDQAWIDSHGTSEVDIANTAYLDLPEDWKGENKLAAEVVAKIVFEAARNGEELNEQFLEKASATIHEKWLERNGSWAPAEQKLPYDQLSDAEKEKDRDQVRRGIELYKKLESTN